MHSTRRPREEHLGMRAWRGLVHLFVCVLPVPAWAPGTAARSSTCEQLDVWIYCMGEPAMGGNGEWRRGTNREQRDPCPLAWLRRDQSTTKAKPIAKQRGDRPCCRWRIACTECRDAYGHGSCGLRWCVELDSLWLAISVPSLASSSRRASAKTDGSR